MKLSVVVYLVVGVAVVAAYACSKESSSSSLPKSSKPAVSFNASTLVAGEPVVFTIQNSTDSAVGKWTVTPDSSSVINNPYSWSGSDTVVFSQPGTYNITIQLKKVMCSAEAAAHPGMDTCFNSGSPVGQIDTTIVVPH